MQRRDDRYELWSKSGAQNSLRVSGIVCGLMTFLFSELLLDKLLEYFVFVFSSLCDFRTEAAVVDVLHADFALMKVPWSQFKPQSQFLPNPGVTRTDNEKAPDTDVLYQAWEVRAVMTQLSAPAMRKTNVTR